MTVSTFTVAADADDGQTDLTDTVYPPTGTAGVTTTGQNISAIRSKSGANFTVQCDFFRWDTSSIPDGDDISAADFKPYVDTDADADARSLVAEYYTWGPLVAGDHTNTAASNAHSGTLISALTNSAVNTLAMQNLSNISKTGFTGLRVHVSGGEPVGLNRVTLADYWDASFPPADLVVTHAVPAMPPGLGPIVGELMERELSASVVGGRY